MRRNEIERAGAPAERQVCREAELDVELRAIGSVDPDEALPLGDVQRAKVDRVDEAENGRVRSDRERNGENGTDREPGVATERARAVANVAREVLEQSAALFIARLFDPVRASAERGQCGSPGFVG